MAKGFIWNSIKDLPVLRSLHVNMRFTSVLILFTTLIFSFSLNSISKKFNWLESYKYGLFLNILTIASFSSYYCMIDYKSTYSNYNILNDVEVWNQINSGNLFTPINNVINVNPKNQSDLFTKKSTSYKPNCPLYGYHGHYFPAKTEVGPVISNEGNYYNFHDPRSFYAPKYFNMNVAERISCENVEDLKLLLNRKQPNWDLPSSQKLANNISLIFLVIFLFFIIFCLTRKII